MERSDQSPRSSRRPAAHDAVEDRDYVETLRVKRLHMQPYDFLRRWAVEVPVAECVVHRGPVHVAAKLDDYRLVQCPQRHTLGAVARAVHAI